MTAVRWVAYEHSTYAYGADHHVVGYYRRDRATGRWAVAMPARSGRGLWDLTLHDDETTCRSVLQARADSSPPGPLPPGRAGTTTPAPSPSGAGTSGPAVPASDAAAGLDVHKAAGRAVGRGPQKPTV